CQRRDTPCRIAGVRFVVMKSMIGIGLLLLASAAFADDRAVAREYLRARCRTVEAGATAADIDRVVALLADDVVVEHPRFGAVVNGKDAVRRGMLSHVGDYTGNADDSGIELLDLMNIGGAVALKARVTFVVGAEAERKVVS